MTTLSINLFGSTRVLLDDDSAPDLPGKKVAALLYYLAVEQPVKHQRETLMTLLWPGMPESSARHNLRQTLYHLRRAFPELSRRPEDEESSAGKEVPFLVTNRQNIAVHTEAMVEVDVVRFAALVQRSKEHQHVELLACGQCRDDLKEAVELYQGDLLADFYLSDSNAFEEWSETRRQYYRRQALDALQILTTMAIRDKQYAEAGEYAQKQLDIDNLRESAYRQLMEVLAFSGRREEALAVYEECRRLLAEELAMAPSKQTTEIYGKIAAGDLSFDDPTAQGVRGYRLKDEIGEGAYGTIHRAVQPTINREVAVKVIRRKYANNPEFIRRFEFEAQTIAHLEHPHIVPLYDYWRDPDGAYLVMRYLKGGNLLGALEEGPWEPEAAADMLDQMAQALSAAHQQGIVHRDIKPANILLDEGGNAYLSDFGIAKDLMVEMQMTAEGAMLGTPDYISPEQILNNPVTAQTDIYSLGAVLYEVLSGERPFSDSSVANLFYKHLNEPIAPLAESRPDLPPQVDEVIQRATAKNPADRYATALEMAAAFRSAVQGVSFDMAGSMWMPEVEELYNPYKGLRAFQEADADDFYGREALVGQLISSVAESRFLAVVGPSGSGKSSAVKAGLIPALRSGVIASSGSIARSDKWFVAEMTPGSHPLDELELALWPIAVDPPPSLVEPMRYDTRGLSRTIRRIMPDEEGAQLLLVIDQFEELFTLVEDEEQREFFIDSLLTAIRDPRSPLRVVVTLRADFLDRPLQMQSLGKLLKENAEIVLPMSAEELTWAVREPARRMGVRLEPGLAEAIVADVSDQPGGLPLLQYALTELFERRQGGMMSLGDYQEIGGVHGALGRRAEEIYANLDESGRESTRQLFLRLVTLGEGVEDTRRRVLRLELEGIGEQATINREWGTGNREQSIVNSQRAIPASAGTGLGKGEIEAVIDEYGLARLLTFDHDPVTREPTVEVAHEALLREWPRLRGWLDESRSDVRLQRMLAVAASEWQVNGQVAGFLLRDARLDQFAGWAATTSVALTAREQAFLEASIAARESRLAEEEARQKRELETAQKLAETEHARAEEQALAAKGLQRRSYILTGALIVAALLALAAVFFGRQSSQNAQLAATREAEAVNEANQRATAQAFAEVQQVEAEEQRGIAVAEAESRATAQAQAVEQQATAEAEALFRATAEAVAIAERDTAEEQTQLSTSREIALAARNNLDNDPELSILLALEALKVRQTNEAQEALHRALQASRVRIKVRPYEENSTVGAAFSPDGTQFLTTDTAGTAIVWDVETGAELARFEGHAEDGTDEFPTANWVVSPDYSPDGQQVVTGGEDGTVRIWDPLTGEELLVIEAHEDIVNVVDFSSDGRKLLTGGQDSKAKIWDLESGELLLAVENIHDGPVGGGFTGVVGADFSPDGSRFVTAGADSMAFVWDAETGEELLQLEGHEGMVFDAAFSPDGTLIATAGKDDSTVQVWDAETGERIHLLLGHASELRKIAFAPDSQRLGTASADGTAKIWNMETGREVMTLEGHDDRLTDIAFSPDGSLALTTSRDRTARVWDVADGQKERLTFFMNAHEARYSPDGEIIISTDDNGVATIWEAASGEELMQFQGTDWSGGAELSPDGTILAAAFDDGTAIVWDVASGEAIYTLAGHDDWVNNLAISPDGSTLATAGNDEKIILWDLETGQEIMTLDQEGSVWDVTFTQDGAFLFSGGTDNDEDHGLAILWDLASGERKQTFPGHVQTIKRVMLSPDESRLLTAAWDGTARLWDVATGEELFLLGDHSGPVWGASYHPDGSMVATGAIDGAIILWDANTGAKLLTLMEGGDEGINHVDFHPDGTKLIAAVQDGTLREFLLPLDALVNLAQTRLTRALTDGECRQYLHVDSCP